MAGAGRGAGDDEGLVLAGGGHIHQDGDVQLLQGSQTACQHLPPPTGQGSSPC